jgi:methyl-accepting chemotaxis protein
VGDDHLKRHQLLTAAQSTSFDKIAKARAEFVGCTERYSISGTPRSGMCPEILVTEAAPRARKILDLVNGAKGADGTRSGGIKSSQGDIYDCSTTPPFVVNCST